MPRRNPFTLLPNDGDVSDTSSNAICLFRSSRLPRILRPATLAFIGLALAVALWGFGYKLSRYNPNQDVSTKASVAKLWDEHHTLSADSAPTVRVIPAQSVDVHLLAALPTLQSTPRVLGYCTVEQQSLPSGPFKALLPLRSPPSPSFWL